jgi:hypothetical protein
MKPFDPSVKSARSEGVSGPGLGSDDRRRGGRGYEELTVKPEYLEAPLR